MSIFSGTIHTLEQSLDYSSLKNKTISNNIANVDTANYKAKDVVFKDVLNSASSSLEAKRTHPKHLPFQATPNTTPYNVIQRDNTTYNHNGNNVDVDKEMTELAKNQIYYQAVVDRLNGKFGSLKTVIKGGR
ncbi:flagellar basal body rod protein FlgB [Salinibacillus xinjiangensis]|uniref:Flagellar basal body rod protein FlgB n=1 Tax=Salinibacillus xinjiangensis TaxID=1229268 RepID=A0A6G1X3C5_9BACI|nr:flagellar basal body rod protein FlgB [Salinibacillus xinjiangensis]MRG85406.1 flagellar basal body rod protein FlgB [Salinibacillus xinjiangensis]